jgi:hypothetical protein
LGVQPEHRVRLLEDAVRVGCEIVGPKRTTKWWFDRSANGSLVESISGPLVEITDNTGVRKHDLRVTAARSR